MLITQIATDSAKSVAVNYWQTFGLGVGPEETFYILNTVGFVLYISHFRTGLYLAKLSSKLMLHANFSITIARMPKYVATDRKTIPHAKILRPYQLRQQNFKQ